MRLIIKIALIFGFVFFLLFALHSWQNRIDQKTSRPPAYAGSFYPADPDKLRSKIQDFLMLVNIKSRSMPRALIVPHAGYQYSGQTAAFAYKTLEKYSDKINRVILLAPSHRAAFSGIVLNRKSYLTPLGVYRIDIQAIRALKKLDFPLVINSVASKKEHSDEVQIPFLQVTLPKAKIVPIIVGDLSKDALEKTARAISQIIDDKTIVISSSDFTHFGPGFHYMPPFKGDNRSRIYALDKKAIEYILNGDINGFEKYLDKTKITICGRNTIRLLLKIFEINDWPKNGKLLQYKTSGDLTGDFMNSVSYAAIIFGGKNPMKPIIDKKYLSTEEEKTLLELSRFVLHSNIERNITKFSDEVISQFKITPAMAQELGVFVTLKKNHQLRGCIGHIQAREPLYKGVIENTINAAVNDPRFPPVNARELKDIEIDISVMTPLEKVENLDKIKVGRDGLILKQGYNTGVFLPQVPIDQNWDKTEYLQELGRKAGLNLNAYQYPRTELYKFSAQVFCESDYF